MWEVRLCGLVAPYRRLHPAGPRGKDACDNRPMRYTRSAIERESPEQYGYDRIKFNLSESSVTDMRLGDLGELDLSNLVLAYGNHLGKRELRELIARESPGLMAEHVLLTPGAAGALFIVNSSLLERGDHAVIAFPNYVTNLDTPRTIRADGERFALRMESGWQVDVDALLKRVTPRTRLVSITTPHNPTGTVMPEATLRYLIKGIEQTSAVLLVDETYRDMNTLSVPPHAASLSPKVISVCSLSKSYGLPGIRMGWLICKDPALLDTFLAAKEQIFIGTSLVDEEIAYRAVLAKTKFMPRIREHIARNFNVVKAWAKASPNIEWVEPQGGCVCFPRVKTGVVKDWDAFYKRLLLEHGTYVGPGHWFDMPKNYMRIGYGWITADVLEGGLAGIDACIAQG